MADSIRLSRFTFAVVETSAQLVCRLTTQCVTRVPEVSSARLIRHVAHHPTHFPISDFPESLTSKLKVVTLLINRIAAVAVNQNPLLNARYQIVQRLVPRRRLQRDVRHTRE